MRRFLLASWVLFAVLAPCLFAIPNVAAAAPNLIPNPSVETAASGGVPANWAKGGAGTNTRVLTYPVAGFDGAKAVKTEITSYTNGDAKWYFKALSTSGGKTYTFSDAYQSNVTSTLTLAYQLQDGTFKYPVLATLPPASSWTTVTRTFTVPTNFGSPVVNVTMFHLIKSVGWIVTDAYALQLADTTPPTVALDPSITDGSGTVQLAATASDDVGVTGVQFYVDGIKIGTEDASAPYQQPWDTTTVQDGFHTLTAVAHDEAMNSATSTPVNFEVSNAPTGDLVVDEFVVNDNGGTKTPGDFPIRIDAAVVNSGETYTLPIGAHAVSANVGSDYTLTFSGDCAADGSITIQDNVLLHCGVIIDDLPQASVMPAANLIANPSVESASGSPTTIPTGWLKGGAGANTRVLTYPVAGFDGAKAVKTEITSYTGGDAKWYFAPIPASSGQQYTYSDYFTSNVPSTVTVQLKLQDGTFKYLDIAANLPAAASWTRVDRAFTVPTYASPVANVTVFHLIKKVGWIATDAYGLALYVPPSSDPANLIANPSMETPSSSSPGLPASWSRSVSPGATATFTYPDAGFDGLRAATVALTAYTGGAGAKWFFAKVPVQAQEDYFFSEEYKSTTETAITLLMTFDDGSTDYLDLMRLTPAATWTKAADTFKVPDHVVSITALHIIQSVGSLTTDDFLLKHLPSAKFAEGMVSLDFDDNYQTAHDNGLPILDAVGMPSTQYVISQVLGTPGYVNATDVQEYAAHGHEIGGHTRSHPNLTTLTPAQLQDEVVGNKNDLVALGLTPTTFAYPYGAVNDAVEKAVRDAGYRGARGVYEGYNDKNTNPFELKDQHVENGVAPATIEGWIDKAIADKTWLILELHYVDGSTNPYATTPAILQQVVNYIRSSGIRVVTNSQGLSAMGY